MAKPSAWKRHCLLTTPKRESLRVERYPEIKRQRAEAAAHGLLEKHKQLAVLREQFAPERAEKHRDTEMYLQKSEALLADRFKTSVT